MAPKKTILIIDDHPLYREGLKAIIGRDDRFEVIGEAGNGYEGLQIARKLKPDLVVVDISLPDTSGIQLTRDIRSLLSEARIIIVSMHSKIDYIAEAFQAGATGYVVKESASDRLIQGLESVASGEYRRKSFEISPKGGQDHQCGLRIFDPPRARGHALAG